MLRCRPTQCFIFTYNSLSTWTLVRPLYIDIEVIELGIVCSILSNQQFYVCGFSTFFILIE